jgi:hypothetical protein
MGEVSLHDRRKQWIEDGRFDTSAFFFFVRNDAFVVVVAVP